MTTRSTLAVAALAAVLADAPAFAQQPAVSVVAIPPLTTPDTGSKGGQSLGIAWQATQMIATDLRSTSELMPLPPDQKDFYSYPEVTAPTFSKWRAAGAKTLVTGFVQSRPDGREVSRFDDLLNPLRRARIDSLLNAPHAAERCLAVKRQ